ncbi:histidine kinase dimerization/phosphoacceptor domain -containing protein [Hyphomonas johnsonii]|jgi:two-component sensor histidine kinase|uniref:Signal transduction histidine kinase n=1 Tax=Hyphomonas johnsonii MHS-2 TaxID=1280950 RepID=A0A059FT44_9PROT|nr:histidine kinase dimerization/phosphoacceptor domain -containing protein [Hyphomonas johnsonii]KCZ93860.1 signal transduction histidine kinase [Hyphomonas johnsonii MHS-2]
MLAAKPANQAERLAALYRYQILDTDREADFDDIVELAAELCGVKISVINLIDADRQWFKAEVGLGVRETPLDTSICSHVILQDDFVEITDTLADTRTGNNPLCLDEPGLRFYAGTLLKSRDGHPIGTLCVLDDQPRELTEFQKKSLRTLGKQVMRELDLRMTLRDQNILLHEMDHRVKNSLQSVSSLVRLYSSRAGANNKDAFDAVARRVDTISLLHQELHQAAEVETVPLEGFIPRVMALLQDSTPENIKIRTEIDPIHVGSGPASAIGMIVSEFVANSIKHAFPDGRTGEILLRLEGSPDRKVTLTCSDNGVGSASAERPESAVEGLGHRLVDAAASQLGCKVVRDATADGFSLSLTFQLA